MEKTLWSTIHLYLKLRRDLLKNHAIPKPLETFLCTVESNTQNKSGSNKELLNPKRLNIPKEEFDALQKLIKLQRVKIITIKPADKGAGILVMNSDYVDSCLSHSSSTQHQISGPPLQFYTKSSEKDLQSVCKAIVKTL